MAEIHKFSFSYDKAEDRLAWDTEDRAGATTRLWLTQRLCRGFVKALIPMLPTGAVDSAPQHASTVQSWEQAAAMSTFGKTPPVQPTVKTVAGLLTALHITP